MPTDTEDQEPCCPEGKGECSDEPGHLTPSEGHCPNCCPDDCTDCADPYTAPTVAQDTENLRRQRS